MFSYYYSIPCLHSFMPKNSEEKTTRQEKRAKRKANQRKMAVHGRGLKKQRQKPQKAK